MNLYEVFTGVGCWYVVSKDMNTAQEMVENFLNKKNYGFTSKRKVTRVDLISHEVTEDRFADSSFEPVGYFLMLEEQK